MRQEYFSSIGHLRSNLARCLVRLLIRIATSTTRKKDDGIQHNVINFPFFFQSRRFERRIFHFHKIFETFLRKNFKEDESRSFRWMSRKNWNERDMNWNWRSFNSIEMFWRVNPLEISVAEPSTEEFQAVSLVHDQVPSSKIRNIYKAFLCCPRVTL